MTIRPVFVDVTSEMSGVEFSTLYLARNLDRTRWDPLVICPAEGPLSQACRAFDIDVAIVPRARMYSISVRIGKYRVPNPFALVLNVLGFVESARRLVPVFQRERADLIITKGLYAHYYGGLAARLTRIPCIWQVQDRVSEKLGNLFPLLLACGARVLARHAIADAMTIARQLELCMPPEQVSVIWNGVDTKEFSPHLDGTGVRQEWGVDASALLIGVVARLVPWKGQHVLLDALAQLKDEHPEVLVVLIGSALFDTDAYARKLHARVHALGLTERVIFAGFRNDLPQVFAALDIVAHTALEKDSTPLAVVSAMASGKPIVCSAVEGTSELFEDNVNGILVPPGSATVLADKLRVLLNDAPLQALLGGNARRFCERELSIEEFTLKCDKVFWRVLN